MPGARRTVRGSVAACSAIAALVSSRPTCRDVVPVRIGMANTPVVCVGTANTPVVCVGTANTPVVCVGTANTPVVV